jgi:hypothetical protein
LPVHSDVGVPVGHARGYIVVEDGLRVGQPKPFRQAGACRQLTEKALRLARQIRDAYDSSTAATAKKKLNQLKRRSRKFTRLLPRPKFTLRPRRLRGARNWRRVEG